MSLFTGEITGIGLLDERLKKFQALALTAQRMTVKETILKIHEVAVKALQENASGTPETRYDPYRKVIASNPGETPNTDTGRLARSVQFEFEDDGMVGKVGTNLKYGAWLEFGTQKMDARPWLQPSVAIASTYVQKIAQDNINEAIEGTEK